MRKSGASGEVQQCAVRLPAMVLTPRAFPREGGKVRTGYVMVMADLTAPKPREIRLGPIRRGSIVRYELGAVVDPVRVIGAVQDIPRRRFVAVEDGSGRNQSADRRDGRALALDDDGHGAAITLADDDDDLALAGSLLG